jgi:hypothetical protein
MSAIEEAVIENLRELTAEQQREVLEFVRKLKQRQPSAQSTRRIWDEIEEISSRVPPEAWAEVPKDGSENVDHYLYGAPKK